MDERFGPELAELLRERLADMRAAETLSDVPLVRIVEPAASLEKEVALDLGAGVQLILKPGSLEPPVRADGAVHWKGLDRVIIQRIEVPHA